MIPDYVRCFERGSFLVGHELRLFAPSYLAQTVPPLHLQFIQRGHGDHHRKTTRIRTPQHRTAVTGAMQFPATGKFANKHVGNVA